MPTGVLVEGRRLSSRSVWLAASQHQHCLTLPAFFRPRKSRFGYETGWSGGGLDGEMEEPDGLEDRVVAIERSLGALQKGLDRLLEQTSPTPAAPAVSSKQTSAWLGLPPPLQFLRDWTRAPLPRLVVPASPRPSCVLLSELASKPNKMLDGRGGRTGGRKVGPLSESEEEAPDAGGAGLAIEESSLPPVERAVVQMSAVLQKTLPKTRRKAGGDLEDLLDRAEGLGFGGGEGSGSLGASRSKARRLSAPLPVAEKKSRIGWWSPSRGLWRRTLQD